MAGCGRIGASDFATSQIFAVCTSRARSTDSSMRGNSSFSSAFQTSHRLEQRLGQRLGLLADSDGGDSWIGDPLA